ncbi:probable helicase with zinc finger domain isoform X1 [Amphibalanus amphitrite]|uniref:probable helicase with zinc finger domain isoform X1 n=1 Tax=Amphibalanus amphitrite TaxID=1232801 RepID=UPI001C90FE7E|nr:probable helicase with zinc finger domain isoform X1 [Amphibalanus amphitrite]
MTARKDERVEWRVAVTAGSLPEGMGLLDTGTRPLFRLGELRCPALLPEPIKVDAREWTCQDKELVERSTRTGAPVCFEMTVSFSADVYGSYRQRLALVFPHHAPLLCWLQANVAPLPVDTLVEELRGKLTISEHGWTEEDAEVIPFSPDPSPPDEQDKNAQEAYPAPSADLAPPADRSPLSAENYAEWSGILLKLEEAARTQLLHTFNVTGQLRLMGHFVVPPETTIHHVRTGELFARLHTEQELSADTAAGRLILDNCERALLAPVTKNPIEPTKRKVYEVLIAAKAKNDIYFRLPSQMVSDLSLNDDDDAMLRAAVRFLPSRQWSCDMQEGCRMAAEKAPHLLFPDTAQRPTIPWNPASHWRPEDEKLNPRQKEAINAMTVTVPQPLPPVLVLGPYGTGKTYTMAHGVKHILNGSEDSRILICTHSNSAADLYIREYLAGYVKGGMESARPLRVYYRRRRLGTVHYTVRPFTLREDSDADDDVVFRHPTTEDILRHRVIVCTLAVSKYLTWLDLPEDTFSHILVDEAAQALEWEAARVLSLAGPQTRLVLAGDHLQLSPDVYSEVCRERRFERSLLERLQERYGSDFPCAITLHENYRSHSDIVKMTSELFYGRRLKSRAHPGRHPEWPPVSVFSARGTARQTSGDTGYCNDEEVYEVADRVAALCHDWPPDWGPRDEGSVCVVAAYAEQVQKIRGELRNRKLPGVTVERLLNVQGKEFRAVFVSTVRTRTSCSEPDGDYRFLSDCKLLNTAVTRARSLIAIVCCPETLCSVGACSRYWEAVIGFAAKKGGLFGTTEAELRSQLGAIELFRLHGLNPLAPCFRPQPQLQPVQHQVQQVHQFQQVQQQVQQQVHPVQLPQPTLPVQQVQPQQPQSAPQPPKPQPKQQKQPKPQPAQPQTPPQAPKPQPPAVHPVQPVVPPPVVPLPVVAPALQLAQQGPLLPWMPALNPAQVRYVPPMAFMSPGLMLGRPLMMGTPLLPYAAPVPHMHPSSNGHRPGRRPTRPPPPLAVAEEDGVLFELMSTTDMIALLPPDVNLQLLLEDTRVQQEWAAHLASRRGPVFAQLFSVLINRLRPAASGVVIEERPASPVSARSSPVSGSSATSPSSSVHLTSDRTVLPAETANSVTVVDSPSSSSSSFPSASSVTSASYPTTPVAAASLPAPVSPIASIPPFGSATSPMSPSCLPAAPAPAQTPPPVAAQLDRILEDPPESDPDPMWSQRHLSATSMMTTTSPPRREASPADVRARGTPEQSPARREAPAAPAQAEPQQRVSLPLYLRGAASPPSPPRPADTRSYAAAVRRSLEPPPPGLAGLPSREQHAHGYSHF